MLWVDKYRPKKLDELACHGRTTELLQGLAKSGEFPHLLFYGLPGAGKKTRVLAFLREIYGDGVNRVKVENRTFKIPPSNSTSVDIQVLTSNFHVEVTPADVGLRDRVVVQQLIKEIASSPPVNAGKGVPGFKVIVINELDRLTQAAQGALRRTMEKYMGSCRLVMCCESLAKVLPPVRSRALGLRVPLASRDEMREVLGRVIRKEKLDVPEEFLENLITQSGRDMRKALLKLEVARAESYPFRPQQQIPAAPWEGVVTEICNLILRDQSPKALMEVRDKFYSLLIVCIPADVIIRSLCVNLLSRVPDMLKSPIIEHATKYEHSMRLGSKDILHLEAFAASCMAAAKECAARGGGSH